MHHHNRSLGIRDQEVPSAQAPNTILPDIGPGEPSNSHEVRMLDTATVRLFRVAGRTRMTIQEDRSWLRVDVSRAFPVSDPDHYIGFMDGSGRDIGILVDPGGLDPESQSVLAEELELR